MSLFTLSLTGAWQPPQKTSTFSEQSRTYGHTDTGTYGHSQKGPPSQDLMSAGYSPSQILTSIASVGNPFVISS